MTKATIIALITAAGIEIPATTTTVAALTELATANGVELKETPDGEKEPIVEFEAPPEPEADADLIAEKVRCGLTIGQAREVIARQRKEDAANK